MLYRSSPGRICDTNFPLCALRGHSPHVCGLRLPSRSSYPGRFNFISFRDTNFPLADLRSEAPEEPRSQIPLSEPGRRSALAGAPRWLVPGARFEFDRARLCEHECASMKGHECASTSPGTTCWAWSTSPDARKQSSPWSRADVNGGKPYLAVLAANCPFGSLVNPLRGFVRAHGGTRAVGLISAVASRLAARGPCPSTPRAITLTEIEVCRVSPDSFCVLGGIGLRGDITNFN